MNPKISVVTVVYNAVKTIEQTMLSVLNQSYENIEYIVIDGGSTDGTVDIIKKYAERLAYWVSEPDKGIYNAMNKGIRKASGEWINFMNAGDVFWARDSVKEVFLDAKSPEVAVIYGDSCVKAFGLFFRRPVKPLAEMRKTIPFCHQASFSRLALMQEHLFNENYKICSDYEFFLHLYCRGAEFCYIPKMLCIFDANGASNYKYDEMLQEMSEISGVPNPLSGAAKFYLKIRLFVFRNFSPLYTLIKKMQYTIFPDSARRNGWEKINYIEPLNEK